MVGKSGWRWSWGGCFFLFINSIHAFVFYYIGLGDIIYIIYRGLKLLYAFSYFFIYFFLLWQVIFFDICFLFLSSHAKGYSAYFFFIIG